MTLSYEKTDTDFTGVLPNGDITHDEDEFFDAWAEQYHPFSEAEED